MLLFIYWDTFKVYILPS